MYILLFHYENKNKCSSRVFKRKTLEQKCEQFQAHEWNLKKVQYTDKEFELLTLLASCSLQETK